MWHDGTTNTPDLDVRAPINYWSCAQRKAGTDPTGYLSSNALIIGSLIRERALTHLPQYLAFSLSLSLSRKLITLVPPDNNDPDYIDSAYECDQYIDCDNLSDELNCSASLPIAFIIFGIGTGLLILFAVGMIIFTIAFGYIWPRQHVKAASPPFLLLICVSCIVGFGSTYAWYGKPEVVACNFQSWLLALSAIVMITYVTLSSSHARLNQGVNSHRLCLSVVAGLLSLSPMQRSLFAKALRIWLLLRKLRPGRVKTIENWRMLIFVLLVTAPLLVRTEGEEGFGSIRFDSIDCCYSSS